MFNISCLKETKEALLLQEHRYRELERRSEMRWTETKNGWNGR